MGLAGDRTHWRSITRRSVHLARTGEPRLHRAARAAVRVTVPKAAVASPQHGFTRAYVFGFCTHYALSRVTYSFVSARRTDCHQFMPGYSAGHAAHLVERHRRCDDRGFCLRHARQYRRTVSWAGCARSPLSLRKFWRRPCRETYGVHITPATVYHSMNDMRRSRHLAHQGASALSPAVCNGSEHLIGKSGFASRSSVRQSRSRRTAPIRSTVRGHPGTGERTDSFSPIRLMPPCRWRSHCNVPLSTRYYQPRSRSIALFSPLDFTGTPIKK